MNIYKHLISIHCVKKNEKRRKKKEKKSVCVCVGGGGGEGVENQMLRENRNG